MEVTDFICSDAITRPLVAHTKDAVIHELLESLVHAEQLDASEMPLIEQAILSRESFSSTGFGKGVAVPHLKTDAVSQLTAAVGISPNGVDFNALDKQPVHVFFLLLSPSAEPALHLQAMEALFSKLQSEAYVEKLKHTDASELLAQL